MEKKNNQNLTKIFSLISEVSRQAPAHIYRTQYFYKIQVLNINLKKKILATEENYLFSYIQLKEFF